MKIKYPYLSEEIELFEAPNGHKIILAHKKSELVNVSTWVKTGSINEDCKNNGVSHFLEHLMFKGTNKYKAGEFDRMLENMGAIINAATWKDYTFYYVTLPKEHLNKAIELHADMMVDPILPEDEIGPPFDYHNPDVKEKRERYVVIEETMMREDQPWSKVYNSMNNAMYKEHPYKMDVIGEPEIISTISRDEIYDYYKRFYTSDNMTTIVVGEFDKDEVLKKLRAEFAFKSDLKAKNPVHNLELVVENYKYMEEKADVNTGYLIAGFLAPPAKDLKTTVILDMISIILGENKSSQMIQNLIEKVEKPIFYYLSTQQYQFRDGNNFLIQANFEASKKEEAICLIKDEIEKFKNTLVSEQDLLMARKKMKILFAQNAETVSDIAETIGYYFTVMENLDIINEYEKILNQITSSDIQKTAREILDIDHCAVSVLMPKV